MSDVPKISIITVVYDAATTIDDCLRSVVSQSYPCEHIVIDGGSTDGTQQRIANYPHLATVISEKDHGIYDAMNKGIQLASGDIVGILNSDDFYCHDSVLALIARVFASSRIDALFADLVYVKPDNLDKIVRYYSGADFTLAKFASGCMPPHPTFFVRRECYERYGLFKVDYRIAADFELMARFMVQHRINCHYLPEVIIKMRTGGVSTRSLKSNIILNQEILRACNENGITTNLLKIYSKYLYKCKQLICRPK